MLNYCSSLWAIYDPLLSINYSIQLSVLWLFTIGVLYQFYTNPSVFKKTLIFSFIFGGIISLLILNGYFSQPGIPMEKWNRISFLNIGLNAIAISLTCSMLYGITYYTLNYRRHKRSKYIFVISIFSSTITFLAILRLGTRSAIWGLFLSILLAVVISYNYRYKKQIIYIILSFSFLFFIFNYAITNDIIQGELLQRVSNIEINLFFQNDRIKLWHEGIGWYTNNLLGSGAGNEEHVYRNLHSTNLEAHNTFVSALIQTNIFGFIMLLMVFILIFKKILLLPKGNYKFSVNIVFIFFFLQCIKGSFIQTRLFWIQLIIILGMIEMYFISQTDHGKI